MENSKNKNMNGGGSCKKTLKKVAAAASLCLAVTAPMMLTGCSEEKVDATKWLTGTEAPAENKGSTGNYYLDTTTNKVYLKEKDGWKEISLLQGQAGNDGVGITKVESEHGFTENGQSCVYFTITYSNGSTETIVSVIPVKVEHINPVNYNVTTYELEDNEIPDMYVNIIYEDESREYNVKVTADMIVGEYDFTKPGSQKVIIEYNGAETDIWVDVQKDVTGYTLVDTASFDEMLEYMFDESVIKIYQSADETEKFVLIEDATDPTNVSYATWDYIAPASQTNPRTVIKVDLGENGGEQVFELNEHVISYYAPLTGVEAEASYTGQINMGGGEPTEFTLDIFSEDRLGTTKVYQLNMVMGPGMSMTYLTGIYNGVTEFTVAGEMTITLNDTNDTFTVDMGDNQQSYGDYVVGEEAYDDFAEAVEAAITSGETLVMMNSASITEAIVVDGDLTIDLNYYTITSSDEVAFVVEDGTLTLSNGTVNGTNGAFKIEAAENGEPKVVVKANTYANPYSAEPQE